MMNTKTLSVAAILVSAMALPTARSAGAASATPVATAAATATTSFKEIKWDDLIPKGWDPYKRFKDRKLVGIMGDGDPRVEELMSEMRMVWDNAPTVTELEGVSVKIPGYIVPLDENHGQLKEFLLVPYFGACIHTPPPPANQIIHVFAKTPIKGFKAMDTVWISGSITQGRKESYMGVSGYEVSADLVTRYEERKR